MGSIYWETAEFGLPLYALSLARLVDSIRPFSGEVIAVNAPWGSGKTSLVNLAVDLLKAKDFYDGDKRVAFIDLADKFTKAPDLAMEVRKVLGQLQESQPAPEIRPIEVWTQPRGADTAFLFLDAIYEAYKNDEQFRIGWKKYETMAEKVWRKVRRNPAPLLQVGSGLTQLAAALTTGQQDSVSLEGSAFAGQSAASLRASLKKALEESLADKPRRLLFVVDDVDRMTPEQIEQLITAIWWVRDIPGVMFLLLYEQSRVIKALAGAHFAHEDDSERVAARYLEKIVQFSYDFPDPDHDELLSNLFSKAMETTGKPLRGEEGFRDTTRERAARKILSGYVTNPRSQLRMINGMEIAHKLLAGKPFDLADFMVVNALKLFDGSGYDELRALVRQLESGVLETRAVDKETPAWKSFLLPAHFTATDDAGEMQPIESLESVRQRHGFGTGDMARCYLQGFLTRSLYLTARVNQFLGLRKHRRTEKWADFKKEIAESGDTWPFEQAVLTRLKSMKRDLAPVYVEMLEEIRNYRPAEQS